MRPIDETNGEEVNYLAELRLGSAEQTLNDLSMANYAIVDFE